MKKTVADKQAHNLLISSQDLTWGYPNSPTMVFHRFNFGLYKNDFCLVTGMSGSGKSTLAKLILRQYEIPSKMLYHKQEDMAKYTDAEVQMFRRKVGVVFQDYKLIERKTIIENIMYPLSIINSPLAFKRSRIQNILRIVGLEKQENRIVQYLSGGEKQKVAIARALIHNPDFIIADEPTGNLDPINAKMIADIFIQLHSLGHTILMITHNMDIKDYITAKIAVSEYSLT